MELLMMAVATVLNFIFIKHKLEKERYADVLFDVAVLALLSALFAGTMGGMVIAMIASALMSIYLYFFPPRFLSNMFA